MNVVRRFSFTSAIEYVASERKKMFHKGEEASGAGRVCILIAKENTPYIDNRGGRTRQTDIRGFPRFSAVLRGERELWNVLRRITQHRHCVARRVPPVFPRWRVFTFSPGRALRLARRAVPRRVMQVPRVSWKIGKVECSPRSGGCTARDEIPWIRLSLQRDGQKGTEENFPANTYSSRVNFNNTSSIIKLSPVSFHPRFSKRTTNSIQVQNFRLFFKRDSISRMQHVPGITNGVNAMSLIICRVFEVL